MFRSRRLVTAVIPIQRSHDANKSQPTGGVILLQDTRPDEPKTLLELKVKKTKVKPAPAPSAGPVGPSGIPGLGSLGSGPRRIPDDDDELSAAIAASLAGAVGAAGLGERMGEGGADAAAGVLNAVDEDEDGEEAEVPQDFDYYSEGDDEDRMEL
jgi:26S proteasome regulatory subunit N2